jgi:hypothetical protein
MGIIILANFKDGITRSSGFTIFWLSSFLREEKINSMYIWGLPFGSGYHFVSIPIFFSPRFQPKKGFPLLSLSQIQEGKVRAEPFYL